MGLYTSIPHNDLQTALRFYLKRRLQNNATPPTDEIIRVVNHVLENNVFAFENECFIQIHGKAMGTRMAPSIATLFMGWI